MKKRKTRSKTELALRYMPGAHPASARRMLRDWINANAELKNELFKTGYKERAILLTPMQVRIIFDYLGKPY